MLLNEEKCWRREGLQSKRVKVFPFFRISDENFDWKSKHNLSLIISLVVFMFCIPLWVYVLNLSLLIYHYYFIIFVFPFDYIGYHFLGLVKLFSFVSIIAFLTFSYILGNPRYKCYGFEFTRYLLMEMFVFYLLFFNSILI